MYLCMSQDEGPIEGASQSYYGHVCGLRECAAHRSLVRSLLFSYLLLLAQGVSELILGEIEECHRAIHGTHQDAQSVQSPERDDH